MWPTADVAGLVGITPKQWQTLLNLLNLRQPTNRITGEFLWILDIGATHHVIGTFSHLCEPRRINGCQVGLLDGSTTDATHEGDVILPKNLKITNVLFMPNLDCNLIYVPQLLDSANCIVQFSKTLCVFQHRRTRTLIGAGERKDGIFFSRGVPKVNIMVVDGMASMDIWHKHLGHPSDKVLRHLPCMGPSIIRGNKDGCDVYFRAHQPRISFSSDSRANRSDSRARSDKSSCGAS